MGPYSYDRRTAALRFNKNEQYILDQLGKSARGTWAFNAGLMRSGRGRYTKLYPTRMRLRAAAVSLQKKGLIKLEGTPVQREGEQYTEYVVRKTDHEYWQN